MFERSDLVVLCLSILACFHNRCKCMGNQCSILRVMMELCIAGSIVGNVTLAQW